MEFCLGQKSHGIRHSNRWAGQLASPLSARAAYCIWLSESNYEYGRAQWWWVTLRKSNAEKAL